MRSLRDQYAKSWYLSQNIMDDFQDIRQAIDEFDYELMELIGEGGFAKVFTVLHRKYNQRFALKVLFLSQTNNNESKLESYLKEVSTLEKICHPNVICIYKYFRDRNHVYIILEYCPNGSLKDKIEKEGALSGTEFISIAKQILSALAYFHEQNISHGDIKPANILFDEYNRPKLGDFGLADTIINGSLSENYLCSPAFAPLEVLKRIPYDPFLADMWSFGITCYFMKTAMLPYEGCRNKAELMSAIEINAIWSTYFGPDLKVIMEGTIHNDPKKRKTAAQLLADPLFNQTLLPKKTISRQSSSSRISAQSSATFPNKKISSAFSSINIGILPKTFTNSAHNVLLVKPKIPQKPLKNIFAAIHENMPNEH